MYLYIFSFYAYIRLYNIINIIPCFYDYIVHSHPLQSTRDSVPSPDYELLNREFGNLRSPPPPSSPKHGDTPTYAQLNSDPYSEPLRLPDFAEPYEQHVPAYAEPYEVCTRSYR